LLGGLSAIEQALAEPREFRDQTFGFLTGQRGGVNFDGQLFGDGLVGAAGQAKPAGAAGKLKQFALAATDAAPETRPPFTGTA